MWSGRPCKCDHAGTKVQDQESLTTTVKKRWPEPAPRLQALRFWGNIIELPCLHSLNAAAVWLQEELQHVASLASAHQRRADLILEAAEANVAQFEQAGHLLAIGNTGMGACHLQPAARAGGA